ncbi:AraC family transcriptional regulator [Caldimonas thermodepolymerans]|uniref:AraC family transcriptional regulator n=2 Tax=Caldimonas thermodepolymerans TaxID=215580 RepID=A0AA46DH84_9BURK|nr:AraC family transcriptional regulator [Caldimonas thermodepolymerans]TCP09480.1 AraC family transcriptional regulator [Caldimonas thermodepolymerans]
MDTRIANLTPPGTERVRDLQASLVRLAMRHTLDREVVATDIPGLFLFRQDAPTRPINCMYEPGVALVLQGAKRVLLGDECYDYRAHQFVITSLDLPALSQVVEASPERPCLGMRLGLDLRSVAEMVLDSRQVQQRTQQPGGRGLEVGHADAALLDAFHRLLSLLDAPQDIAVMAPLVQREIIYRLLMSDQGARLRHIASAGSHGHRVARAIDWIKAHYAEPLRVQELAARVQMSVSSFHLHFRQLTSMSPLQYQKWLRLNEARRLMLVEGRDASTAAARVGYESPSQFSREYKRLFGVPPRRDMESLRSAPLAGIVPAEARAPATMHY